MGNIFQKHSLQLLLNVTLFYLMIFKMNFVFFDTPNYGILWKYLEL